MKPTLEITAGGCIFLAAAVLLLPFRVLVAAACASAIHEASHLVILCILGIPVYRISVEGTGIRIHTGDMNNRQEFLCAVGGPFGSFLLVLFAGWFPILALFGMVQGIYNLLPVYPLDGGRMVRCCLCHWLGDLGKRLSDWIGSAVILLALLLCWIGGFFGCCCALAVLFAIKGLARKIPCKDVLKRVQ